MSRYLNNAEKREVLEAFNIALSMQVYECQTDEELDILLNQIAKKVSAVCWKRSEQLKRKNEEV